LRAVIERAGSEREEAWLLERKIDLDRVRVNGKLEHANTARAPDSMKQSVQINLSRLFARNVPDFFRSSLEKDDARLPALIDSQY